MLNASQPMETLKTFNTDMLRIMFPMTYKHKVKALQESILQIASVPANAANDLYEIALKAGQSMLVLQVPFAVAKEYAETFKEVMTPSGSNLHKAKKS
jgi:hypothetical protein